jgi:hypothetical protein
MAGPTEGRERVPGAGGNGEHGEQGESADAARARRERALSALARATDPSSAAAAGGEMAALIQPGTSGRRRGRMLQIALAGVLLVAVVTALALHFAPRGRTTSAARRPAPPLQLADAQARIGCPRDVTWSPDGSHIAVLGYAQRCPFYEPDQPFPIAPDAIVAVYDTASGRLAGEFHPDDLIRKTVTLPPSVQAFLATANVETKPRLGVELRHIRWLPDGKRLAVTGYFFLPSGPPVQNDAGLPSWPGALTDALLVADASGGQAQVATTPAHVLATPIPITELGNQTMDTAVEWDLATMTPVALPATLAPSSPQGTLAPALAYQWGPGGALSIRTPLGNAPAAEPIDAPDGAWFSVWQPAVADEGIVFVGKSPLYRWWSEFAALAPDGRYLLDGGVIEWVVRPTGQPADPVETSFTHTEHAPLLPLRDAAMRTLFDDLTADGVANHGSASVLTAWRPDGKVLVAGAAVGDPRNPRDAIRFYESAGGKLLSTLNVPARSLADVQGTEPRAMRWSPDGSRLFLLDPNLQLATIWGPGTLPK